ncbi:hypothetical protein [Kineosporia babensis]|uniref:Uncharacterized protein n=1 Tax=Kineosporia babensis TaxID=499548 RepID=A0A9X1NEG9_9ACTN|nr:hypothetical protein [Kineosporia babensis]MCD5313637.1 hypothetical protein [Kineosporia babensis]
MHANLYNFELIKIEHDEALRLAADERWATIVRRANRRTRRALWTKVIPALRAVTG